MGTNAEPAATSDRTARGGATDDGALGHQALDGTTADDAVDATGRRMLRVFLVCGSISILGLFIDGWAHRVDKPETFFSPWHAVLYAGFALGMVLAGVDEARRIRSGAPRVHLEGDRLVTLGVALFVAGGVGDMIWHEIFGIEVDLETLLSPTHLMLMLGGLAMGGGTVLTIWRRPVDRADDVRLVALSLGLGAGLLGFFLQFASPFLTRDLPVGGEAEALHVTGVLMTTPLLVGPMLLASRRWVLPRGAALLAVLPLAVGLTVMSGFDQAAVCAAILAGGVAGELTIVGRSPDARRAAWTTALAVPVVVWVAYFATVTATEGMAWPAELWTGSVVLAAVVGAGLALLAAPPTR